MYLHTTPLPGSVLIRVTKGLRDENSSDSASQVRLSECVARTDGATTLTTIVDVTSMAVATDTDDLFVSMACALHPMVRW